MKISKNIYRLASVTSVALLAAVATGLATAAAAPQYPDQDSDIHWVICPIIGCPPVGYSTPCGTYTLNVTRADGTEIKETITCHYTGPE